MCKQIIILIIFFAPLNPVETFLVLAPPKLSKRVMGVRVERISFIKQEKTKKKLRMSIIPKKKNLQPNTSLMEPNPTFANSYLKEPNNFQDG